MFFLWGVGEGALLPGGSGKRGQQRCCHSHACKGQDQLLLALHGLSLLIAIPELDVGRWHLPRSFVSGAGGSRATARTMQKAAEGKQGIWEPGAGAAAQPSGPLVAPHVTLEGHGIKHGPKARSLGEGASVLGFRGTLGRREERPARWPFPWGLAVSPQGSNLGAISGDWKICFHPFPAPPRIWGDGEKHCKAQMKMRCRRLKSKNR